MTRDREQSEFSNNTSENTFSNSTEMNSYYFVNSELISTKLPKKQVVLSSVRSCYTTCLACIERNSGMLDFHVLYFMKHIARIHSSMQYVLQNCSVELEGFDDLIDFAQIDHVENVVRNNLNDAFQHINSVEGLPYDVDTLRITFLMGVSSEKQGVFCGLYIEKAPELRMRPVTVCYSQHVRHNPNLKLTSWAKEREALLQRAQEFVHPEKCEDVVLLDENGCFTEGCSSNFFVFRKDNIVETCPLKNGVLSGTMRSSLCSCLENSQFILSKNAPTNEGMLSDVSDWVCPCITSTSRIILPVTRFINLDTQEEHIFTVPNFISDLFDELKDLMKQTSVCFKI
ncbi:hypothetical protein PCE1_000834 [Barthelona sp. PCE]